jgi:hypothetical protein
MHNPMSDRHLERKFRDLTAGTLPASQADALLAQCWAVEALRDVAQIAHLAVP